MVVRDRSERKVALTPEHVVRLVESAKTARADLRERFEKDFKTYQGVWSDSRWPDGALPEGYDSYTSNGARTFADRIIGMLIAAEMNVQIPMEGNNEEERKVNEKKEQFILGALRQVDNAQVKRMLPKLKAQLAFYIPVRGWYCGRALLVKQEDGSTSVVVDAFDPMHTYYGMGSEGLEWVCHVTKRTRDEIYEEYGLDLIGEPPDGPRSLQNSDAVGVDVYDFYDKTHRAVAIKDQWALEPAEHYSAGEVPCFFGAVGPVPQVVSKDSDNRTDNLQYVGESIFAANRALYDQWNKTMSDIVSLVRRSLKQVIVYKSKDGTKTIPGDPSRAGAEIGIAEGEEIRALEMMGMAKDTDKFLGSMSGEMQRGSLPNTVFGEQEFQASGYAIKTLRQGLELVIQYAVTAMETAYQQIARLLCAQYATGMFKPIKASGYLRQAYFNRAIQPQEVAMVEDELEITLLPNLPSDDIAMYTMAEMAVRSGLLSLRTARDHILKLQNADQEDARIKASKAEVSNPLAAMFAYIKACIEEGDMTTATVLTRELAAALALRGELPEQYLPKGAGVPSLGPRPGGPPPQGGGVRPEAGPPAEQGYRPGPPFSVGARTGLPAPPNPLMDGNQAPQPGI